MKLPNSLEIERTFLASLIKYPIVIPEYLDHLSDDLFYVPVHQTIAGAIRFQFKQKKTVDAVILADHIANIGLKNQDDIDIPEYIRTISLRSAVAEENISVYFKDCYKYKIARSTIESLRKAEMAIHKGINGPLKEIMASTEKHLANAATASIEDDYELTDVYEDMPEFLENMAEKGPMDGIMTPFKTWNRWWGPLTEGDLAVIAAPPKTGKSTILNYIADAPFCRYNAGRVIKVLILDTELESYRVRTRKASAMSDVNEIYIKNGKWQKDSDMVDKVTAQFPKMKKRAGFVKHVYVANKPIEEICKIVKRWAATETDPDDLRLVVYDYLKITGEKIDDSNKEWQALGAKCDTLKHLMSDKSVRAAGLCAVQTNALNDVAASQRIKWFASQILFFNKKTPEELSADGEEFGTHTLHPFCLRNQGEDWDADQWVKVQKKDGVEFKINKIQLKVQNFDMKECGTYGDVVKKGEEQIDITGADDDSAPWKKDKNKKIKVEEDLL